MTQSDREVAGQRIARARRRRGLSQAVLAGLIGRSESWLSQVERGKRGVDSHSVLVRLAEVLRVDIEEFTGSGDQDETGRRAYPAASLIEQAMMGYGTSGPVDGGDEPGGMRTWTSCARGRALRIRLTRPLPTTLRPASCPD
jgi:transcriptional regulator with XRE-family HTH domain